MHVFKEMEIQQQCKLLNTYLNVKEMLEIHSELWVENEEKRATLVNYVLFLKFMKKHRQMGNDTGFICSKIQMRDCV